MKQYKITKSDTLSPEEKKEIIRAKVLDISREIFARQGFQKMSIDKIAQISGMELSEITKVYPTINHIYYDVFIEETRIFYDEMYMIVQEEDHWLEMLRKGLNFAVTYLHQKSLARNIIFPFGKDIPINEKEYLIFRRRAGTYELPVKQHMENIFDRELFPGHATMFVEIIFDFLRGLVIKINEGYELEALKKEIEFFLNLIM